MMRQKQYQQSIKNFEEAWDEWRWE